MKKIFTLAVLLVFIGAAAEVNAQVWRNTFTVYKGHYATYVTPIKEVNEVGFMGTADSIIYRGNGFSDTLRQGARIFALQNGRLKSVAPDIQAIDPRSYVYDAVKVGAKTYVSFNEWNSPLTNSLKVIENGIMTDVPVKFGNSVKIHPYDGGKKMLIYGNAYSAEDREGVKTINGTAFLNLETNIITPSPVSVGGTFGDKSIGKDGTLAYRNTAGIWAMFKEGEWLKYSDSFETKQVCVANKDSLFRIEKRASDGIHVLYQSRGSQWESLGTFSSNTISSTEVDNTEVYSLEYYKGKLLIAHSALYFEGVSVNNVFAFDIATRTIKNIAYPSGLNRNNFDESFIKVVQDSIYLVERNENTFVLERSRIWSLQHDGLLPVVLKNFSGVVGASGMHQLNWETANETSFSHFDVESSADGSQFKMMTKVPARGGGTYTASIKAVGKVFYRLKMVDKDGEFSYSKIIPIGTAFDVFWVQNPVGSTLKIIGPAEKTVQLAIYTMSGQQLSVQKVQGMREIAFPYPRGMYIIVFLSDNERKTQKILF